MKRKYIYVLDQNGKPLMPTERLGMVRRWLKNKQVHWYQNSRDTIQFDRPVEHHLQNMVQGCDLGDHLGISVIANNHEVYSSESYCDSKKMHERLIARKMYRRTRRTRLLHRQARFNNRTGFKNKYAPSVLRKLQFQINEIKRISDFLPVSQLIFEGSVFDINRLTRHMWNQQGYHNLLDYLYDRDGGCDALDGQVYPKNQLVIHHLIHRANGGTNNPDNLVLLSRIHHNQANHKNGLLDQLTKARQKTFHNIDTRGAYFMNILNVELPKHFNYLPTFGYLTALKRKLYGIRKTHHDDAFVIAGGTNKTERLGYCYCREKLRRNNRSLAKFYDAVYLDVRDGNKKKASLLSSGRTSRSRELNYDNQRICRGNKIKAGHVALRKQHYQLRPHDLVKFNGEIYQVKGVQNYGQYVKIFNNLNNKTTIKTITKLKTIFHTNGIYQQILD